MQAALLDILIQFSTDLDTTENADLKLTALRTLSKLCTNVLHDPLNDRYDTMIGQQLYSYSYGQG